MKQHTNDKKAKLINANVECNLNETSSFILTSEHLQILDKEYQLHLSGKTASYTWNEAKEIIRGKNSLK